MAIAQNPVEQNNLFEELYLSHHQHVYHLAYGLTGNAHDAEEVTQEAFFRAFRAYHTFRNDSSFFTWIYRITLNIAKDYLKIRAKLPLEALTEDYGYSIEQLVDPNPANDPETQALANEVKYKCLHFLIECLPINQRKVFCLAITLDLPHKIVAEILGCSVGSVKTTLHRAKKRWVGYMENRCSLIKKSNPCHCNQWVRFGLEKGWLPREIPTQPRPAVMVQAKEEILKLKDLREIYQNLYQKKADKSFAERVREGIQKKEWANFL